MEVLNFAQGNVPDIVEVMSPLLNNVSATYYQGILLSFNLNRHS